MTTSSFFIDQDENYFTFIQMYGRAGEEAIVMAQELEGATQDDRIVLLRQVEVDKFIEALQKLKQYLPE